MRGLKETMLHEPVLRSQRKLTLKISLKYSDRFIWISVIASSADPDYYHSRYLDPLNGLMNNQTVSNEKFHSISAGRNL
jgi:hypothetical protein